MYDAAPTSLGRIGILWTTAPAGGERVPALNRDFMITGG
jgi:hypothetical protein